MISDNVAALQQKISAHMSISKALDAIDHTTAPLQGHIKMAMTKELTSAKYQIPEIKAFVHRTNFITTFKLGLVTYHVLHRDPDMNEDVPFLSVEQVVRRLNCIMTLCNADKPITFYLIPCTSVKEFPVHKHHDMDVQNVNSAYTYDNDATVYIYRREEFPKVSVHEAIHHVRQIETRRQWDAAQLKRMYTIFNIHSSTELRPNEAIVETWAELFHTIFVSIKYNLEFEMLYKKEMLWALQQAKRILNKQNGQQWKDSTQSYSYHVLRSLYLFTPNDFMPLSLKKDIDRLIDHARVTFTSESYAMAIQAVRVPHHNSFRMTLFGDL
jgi:hypothetical protein